MRSSFRNWLPPLVIGVWLALDVAPVLGQARVVGTVRDENRRPIKGATVTVENQRSSFTVTTDEDGDFGLVTLEESEYTFTVQAPGYTPSQRTVRVRALVRNPTLNFLLALGASGPVGNVSAINADDLQTLLHTAEEAYAAGRYEEAVRGYREIMTSAPALTTVGLKLGSAYLHNRQYTEAQTAYQAVLTYDLDPSLSRELFYDLGDVRVGLQQPDEALGWYWQAHTTDPAWIKPLLKLGRMAVDSGDRAAARMYLETGRRG